MSIVFNNTQIFGMRGAIRGMRNPLASWEKSDSFMDEIGVVSLGADDLALAKKLGNAGTDHRKFLRQIYITVDITGPLYWWKQFDQYKMGVTTNSTSTMHCIAKREFTRNDFSHEQLKAGGVKMLDDTIGLLNMYRDMYLKTKDKEYWWQMIQLLPSSYNQMRTVAFNYEVVRNMYHARKSHKLDEWRVGFVAWVMGLPYAEHLIIGE